MSASGSSVGRLLIRCDASPAIGTGHVMRCLALAQAWRDSGGTVSFATAESTPPMEARLRREGMRQLSIVAAPSTGLDRDQFRAIARVELPAWVVVDGYEFDERYIRALQSDGLKVLQIDDAGRREPITADMLLNQNSNARPDLYPHRADSTRLLLGTKYALLRREFRQPLAPGEVREHGNRILITLGGSDPDNLTPQIVETLVACPHLQLTAILGSSNPGANSTAERLRGLNASQLSILSDPPNMAELMRASDLAIIIGGGTLWELLASGCAVLSYSRNPVQTHILLELAQSGALVHLGETSNFDPAALAAAVTTLAESKLARGRMAALGRSLVDGQGAARAVEAMTLVGGAVKVDMAPIEASERADFLRMATAHFTELDSGFDPDEDWKTSYFETILANPLYFLRWLVADGNRAGFILFGIEKHRFLPRQTGVVYELYVLPEFRQRGIARTCALQAIRELWTHGPSKIQLEVLEGRSAAAALWKSLGFRKTTDRLVLTRNSQSRDSQ